MIPLGGNEIRRKPGIRCPKGRLLGCSGARNADFEGSSFGFRHSFGFSPWSLGFGIWSFFLPLAWFLQLGGQKSWTKIDKMN